MSKGFVSSDKVSKEINLLNRTSKVYVFFCRECSDLEVGGWVSTNPNIVRICKSVQIIGRSLTKLQKLFAEFTQYVPEVFLKQ